jgi:hypothetical protein
LQAGRNIQLAVVQVGGEDPVIRINAISGEGTVEDCVCEGDEALGDPIRTILGVGPTPEGDFTIVGTDCLQIETVENGIRLRDVCAQPCCGCEELERITQDLERLNAQAATIDNFVDSLRVAVDTMSLTVLGARLGDRGCSAG